MPDPMTPEARRKAADALLAYITGRWVVCDHAQILDPAGAVDAVVDALDRHDADEVKRLREQIKRVRVYAGRIAQSDNTAYAKAGRDVLQIVGPVAALDGTGDGS